MRVDLHRFVIVLAFLVACSGGVGCKGSGGEKATSAPPRRSAPVPKIDFDNDGKPDLVLYRKGTGEWHVLNSSKGFKADVPGGESVYRHGSPDDQPLPPVDLDGDGKPDLLVFRPSAGQWIALLSGKGYSASAPGGTLLIPFGQPGDVAQSPKDFDGDGKLDPVLFRPGKAAILWQTTIVLASASKAVVPYPFGAVGDLLVPPSDLDGDGRPDVITFRPEGSNPGFWVLYSRKGYDQNAAAGLAYFPVGQAGDVPLAPRDFEGDGRLDLVLYRPSRGEWLIASTKFGARMSAPGAVRTIAFGEAGDIPLAPQDLDGDGNPDLVMFRPGTGEWRVLKSARGWDSRAADGVMVIKFGQAGDIPMSGEL